MAAIYKQHDCRRQHHHRHQHHDHHQYHPHHVDDIWESSGGLSPDENSLTRIVIQRSVVCISGVPLTAAVCRSPQTEASQSKSKQINANRSKSKQFASAVCRSHQRCAAYISGVPLTLNRSKSKQHKTEKICFVLVCQGLRNHFGASPHLRPDMF